MQGTFSAWLMKVSFPKLGLEFDIDRVAFTIFGIDIYWYAVIIVFGFSLAAIYGYFNRRKYGLTKDTLMDLLIVGTVFGVLGARLYYVIFSGGRYDSLWQVLNMRDGGLAIYGAVIGAAVSEIIACRIKKIPFLAACDVMVIGFFIGQSIGRWGNFANQEAFGRGTSLPWGMQSANTLADVPGSPVHPCFLYESIWCALGFLLLHILSKKCYKFRGQLSLVYALWYGLGRVWIEQLRTDSLYLIPGVIKISQLLAILSLAAIPLLWMGFKNKSITIKGKTFAFAPALDIPDIEWKVLDRTEEKSLKEEISESWGKISGFVKRIKNKK